MILLAQPAGPTTSQAPDETSSQVPNGQQVPSALNLTGGQTGPLSSAAMSWEAGVPAGAGSEQQQTNASVPANAIDWEAKRCLMAQR